MLAAYPVQSDLNNFLTAANINLGTLDTGTAVNSGITIFEKAVGRIMFPQVNQTRTFDPPTLRGMLDLKADLATGVTPVVVVQGVTKTVGTDYRFWPIGAPYDNRPWNAIEFKARWLWPNLWDANDQISITGRWGYRTDGIEEPAWRAMLAAGALDVFPQLAFAFSRGMVTWTEAHVTESYGPKPMQYLHDTWKEYFDLQVSRYRRTVVGLAG